ncbi:hypothetical protein MNV49_002614 [Pseudohyphozyma bogoriensis]|nr:hypothetical protein MNV49_002614 [Pseudohyphozyma bogoriensis]
MTNPQIPYPLALELVQSGLENHPEGFDSANFLDAYTAAQGDVDQLSPLHKTAAYAFLADGASISSDPLIAGANATPSTSIPTVPFCPPPTLRTISPSRASFLTPLSTLAWHSLHHTPLTISAKSEEGDTISFMEGLALLAFISERFEHPDGMDRKVEHLAKGLVESSDLMDNDQDPAGQSNGFTLGASLFAVTGEYAWAHNLHPPLSRFITEDSDTTVERVWSQWASTSSLSPLPSTSASSLDLSPAFSTDPTGTAFVSLFSAVVVPLQKFCKDLERLHARDIVDPHPTSVESLWAVIEGARAYAAELVSRILGDERLKVVSQDEAGEDYITNPWTRALLKNLLVQETLLSSFVLVMHRNLVADAAVEGKAKELLKFSEEKVVALLKEMSGNARVVKRITKNLDDIAPIIKGYAKALHNLNGDLVPFLLRLPRDDIDVLHRVLGYASYYDAEASRTLDELEAKLEGLTEKL